MAYKVGIGVLIGNETCNEIRHVELQLAEATGNWSGLNQPPHITVKRPFEVANLDELQQIVEVFDRTLSSIEPFSITYRGITDFNRQVLLLEVGVSKALVQLHQALLDALEQVVATAKQPFEGGLGMIFHTSLALSLKEDEFIRARKLADALVNAQFDQETPITRVGLFFSNDATHWAVVREKELYKR